MPATKRQLIARGRTAEVYAWSPGLILKLFYEWVPQSWIQREVQVGKSLAHSSLRTPSLLDVVLVDGRTGIILERVDGPSMLALLPVKPWLIIKMAHVFADLHSSMHDILATDLPPLRLHLDSAILKNEALPSHIKDHALQVLAELPDGDALCHFDFHPDQVVIAAEGPVIIDWMTALRGDPMADVARTSTLLRFGQAPHANWLVRKVTDAVRSSFRARYLKHYFHLHPGATRHGLAAWHFPVATARLAEDVPGERDSLLDFLETSLAEPKAA